MLGKRSTRWTERSFVVEGVELLRSALEAGAAVESVYVGADGWTPGTRDVLARAEEGGARIFDLAPGVLERVADTVTPQPVMAVLPMLDVPLSAVTAPVAGPHPVPPTGRAASDGTALVVVCAGVRDPGNAGTILRSADAAGVSAVVVCGSSVDPYNPKAVRSSAGSLFNVPVTVAGGTEETLEALGAAGLRRVGAVARGGEDYAAFDWSLPTALVLGNETAGLAGVAGSLLDARVAIPMAGRAESLNVGMACAVLCFEAVRHRRAGAP